MPRAATSVATSVVARPEWNGLHVAGAGALAEVAVQVDRRDAAAVELAGQRLGAVLGAGEHDGAAGRAGQVDQHRDAAARAGRAARGGPSWRSATAPSRPGGSPAERRNWRTRTSMALSRVAEKSSRWPVFGVWLSRRRTDGQEAEVGHVVGLVEHGDLDVAEAAVALADEVLEPAGAGDHDVDAGLAGRGPAGSGRRRRRRSACVSPAAAASGARAASIWPTSSRVGARIRARGAPRAAAALVGLRRATSGSRKA